MWDPQHLTDLLQGQPSFTYFTCRQEMRFGARTVLSIYRHHIDIGLEGVMR
jgi:hypothetical protein